MLNIHVQYRYRYRYWQNLSYKYRVSEVSAKTGIGTPLLLIILCLVDGMHLYDFFVL